MSETVVAVDSGWIRAHDLATPRGPAAVLVYPTGVHRIRHQCKRLAGDGRRLVCAPMFQFDAGHLLVSSDPLTIIPSILCPDCGLHGYVTNGRWVDAASVPIEEATDG